MLKHIVNQVICLINYFFIIVFLFALVYGMLTGRIKEVEEALMKLPQESIMVFFKMANILIFFQGIMQIALDAGLISFLSKFTNKLLKPLFPKLDDKEALNYISLNLISNFLGLSGASSSAGFKAMERLTLRTKNRECSKEIITFLSLNVSGFCLIPQTIVSLRESYSSKTPSAVILPAFLVSFLVIVIVYVINWRFNREV